MEAATIVVLVFAAIFFGSIVWLAIYSRRQSAEKEPSGVNEKQEQASETEPSADKRVKRRR